MLERRPAPVRSAQARVVTNTLASAAHSKVVPSLVSDRSCHVFLLTALVVLFRLHL